MRRAVLITAVWLLLAAPALAMYPTPQEERPARWVGPAWATAAWQDYAAHIVAGETRGVPSAAYPVACTLIGDVERGMHPWRLRGRWYGWKTPNASERAAVRLALAGCEDVPRYRFVGNLSDLRLWQERGMVAVDGPFDLYTGTRGLVVVGVRD
jgi:hypothetical protein